MINTSHRIDYFSGWRFLLSPRYRRSVQKRWTAESPHIRSLDIAGMVVTLLVTGCGLLLVAALLLDLAGR